MKCFSNKLILFEGFLEIKKKKKIFKNLDNFTKKNMSEYHMQCCFSSKLNFSRNFKWKIRQNLDKNKDSFSENKSEYIVQCCFSSKSILFQGFLDILTGK